MNNLITILNFSYAIGHQYITNNYISIMVGSTVLSLTMIAMIKYFKNDIR